MNAIEFDRVCSESLERLTPDEERALLSGMTADEIEAAR
jgi:hypothetical protein